MPQVRWRRLASASGMGGADAEVHGQGTYREVMKALAKVIEGTPRIETREVSNSTFHKIAAHVAA